MVSANRYNAQKAGTTLCASDMGDELMNVGA